MEFHGISDTGISRDSLRIIGTSCPVSSRFQACRKPGTALLPHSEQVTIVVCMSEAGGTLSGGVGCISTSLLSDLGHKSDGPSIYALCKLEKVLSSPPPSLTFSQSIYSKISNCFIPSLPPSFTKAPSDFSAPLVNFL